VDVLSSNWAAHDRELRAFSGSNEGLYGHISANICE
jgi:hypothetical protein